MVVVFFGFGWMDRSASGTIELGAPRRVVVVTDAGPVRVLQGEVNSVDHDDSWLVRRPTVERGQDDDEVVIRIRCDTSLPCRSALTVRVVAGTELVVIADDGSVSVDRFDGALTVFADHDAVTLGPIRGSARIVAATGDVHGFGLALGDLTVEVDRAAIDLEFASSPLSVALTSVDGPVTVSVPDTGYEVTVRVPEARSGEVRLGIESDPDAEAKISILGDGPVVVQPFVP